MKNLKNLRVKQMLFLLNKWELKRILAYKKFQSYKRNKEKTKAMKKFLLLDKFVCKLHNRILKYIPEHTLLCDGDKILNDNIPMWNNYTIIKFY